VSKEEREENFCKDIEKDIFIETLRMQLIVLKDRIRELSGIEQLIEALIEIIDSKLKKKV